jgi:hypothetical protein
VIGLNTQVELGQRRVQSWPRDSARRLRRRDSRGGRSGRARELGG